MRRLLLLLLTALAAWPLSAAEDRPNVVIIISDDQGWADIGSNNPRVYSPHLDRSYTAFGRVVKGIEVVDAITELEIDTYGRWGPRDRPYPVTPRVETVRVAAPGADALAAGAGDTAKAS